MTHNDHYLKQAYYNAATLSLFALVGVAIYNNMVRASSLQSILSE
jgi:hypothetical protein